MAIADEIADIQAEAASVGILDQLVFIQRETKSADGAGHDKPVWVTQNGGLSVLSGWKMQSGTIAQEQAETLGVLNLWRVQFAVGTDLKAEDRLLKGANIFHVHDVDSDQSLQILLEATVSELQTSPEDQPGG